MTLRMANIVSTKKVTQINKAVSRILKTIMSSVVISATQFPTIAASRISNPSFNTNSDAVSGVSRRMVLA